MNKIGKVKLDKLISNNAVKPVLLVDMRSPVEYRDSHLSESVNLPLKNFVNKIMGMPRDSIIVAYSTQLTDVDLAQGMNYAEQLGFKNVYAAEYATLR